MRPLFLFLKSEKTDEGHLKQVREGLRNNLYFIWSNCLQIYDFFYLILCIKSTITLAMNSVQIFLLQIKFYDLFDKIWFWSICLHLEQLINLHQRGIKE